MKEWIRFADDAQKHTDKHMQTKERLQIVLICLFFLTKTKKNLRMPAPASHTPPRLECAIDTIYTVVEQMHSQYTRLIRPFKCS